jgi:hypothetical protein
MINKMPPDFVQAGHMRQIAWCRDNNYDWAVVLQHRMTAQDLRDFAVWAVKAAEWLEDGKLEETAMMVAREEHRQRTNRPIEYKSIHEDKLTLGQVAKFKKGR